MKFNDVHHHQCVPIGQQPYELGKNKIMVNRYHELSRMEGKAECYPCLFVGGQNVWFGLTELECGVRGVPFPHLHTIEPYTQALPF